MGRILSVIFKAPASGKHMHETYEYRITWQLAV